MSWLSSIRVKTIFIIACLMVLPAIILGSAGSLYYQDVLKHNIWEDNLAEAKAISELTTSYIDLSEQYLNSLAVRSSVISGIEEGNSSSLNVTARYGVKESFEFDSIFITDTSGKVLSYQSSNRNGTSAEQVGKDYYDRPCVRQVLDTSAPYVSDARINDVDGMPTVYIGVPVRNASNRTVGVLVGAVDLGNFSTVIMNTSAKNGQYIYLVNNTGHVMVYSNMSYMDNMTDFSMLAGVQKVVNGEEGVIEDAFPFENNMHLAAYAPVRGLGWGVVVSLPVDEAYWPVTQFTWYVLILLIVLLFIALALSVFFGNYIANPIIGMSGATMKVPEADPKTLEQYLPMGRRDEIGDLARSFLGMANIIKTDREQIISARNQAESEKKRAEEEKQRAELYVDIMEHDINSLNQSALANLEMLDLDKNTTPEQNELIGYALSSVLSSAAIIDKVRKLQKISGNELQTERVDLDELIRESIRRCHIPDGKKAVIRYAPGNGMYIMGNPLLEQAFCNLIDNSIKYSGKDVEIEIGILESSPAGGKVYEVSVSDNGYGIPDDAKKKMFDRFRLGTTKALSKGLGLYISKKLLEKYDGSMEIRDRVPGDYKKGTTIVVKLPALVGSANE